MYSLEASPEFRQLAENVPIPIKWTKPEENKQIWAASSSPSPQETALLEYYEEELFPRICEEAERSGLADLVRDSDPLVVFLEKGGQLWPGANQVVVFIVLDPSKTKNKETDDTAPDLPDSDPAIKSPSPQTSRPAADLGALKSSKNREGKEIVNRVSENVTPPGSPPEMREKYQRLLEILQKPRDVATWRRLGETEPPSDVKPRTFGAGDLVMLNAREFIGVAAGGTLLLGMRYRCKRVVDQYVGEAREPSMAA